MTNLTTKESALAFFTNVEEVTPEQEAATEYLSRSIRSLVIQIFNTVPAGAERTLALRALKDCRARCVEAILFPL